jgi:hypothetical protein
MAAANILRIIRRRMTRITALQIVVAAILLCSIHNICRAQPASGDGAPEFSLSIGYANVSLSDSPVIDGENALRFEPVLSFSPIEPLPQLRLGASVGVTLVLDNSTRTISSGDNGLIYRGSSDVPLWLLEPELRISWRQYLDANHMVFLEPGVGAGYAFGFLELQSDDQNVDSYDADASTFFGRGFVRLGGRVTGGLAGIEASYMQGSSMNFGGDASGDVEEFYIGIFGALSF